MSWLVYHVPVLAVLILVAVHVLLNLSVFRAPRRPALWGPDAPLVSVLVPARNEAHRIRPCLESLLAQDYPALEILVLDDHSTDGTADLVRGMGFSDSGPRRIVPGAELPPGWMGKSWACHQLAGTASGGWLLFTDADTVHAPDGVSSAVAHARATGAGLLSAWPEQITRTLGEKLVIPLGYLLVMGFLPHFLLALLQRCPALAKRCPQSLLASMGAANGQYLLFRRDTYLATGGHAAERGHLVEDLALGRLVAGLTAQGHRLVNCDGRRIVRCRMYESLGELWEGFTKNMRPAFDGNGCLFLAAVLFQFAVMVLPFLLLPWAGHIGMLLWIEAGGILLLRAALALRFRSDGWSVLLHPFGYGLILLIALNSWRRWHGPGVLWKGRSYRATQS